MHTLGQAPPTSRVAVQMHWYIVRSKKKAYVRASTSNFTYCCSVYPYDALVHSTSNFTCCCSVPLYDALVHCANVLLFHLAKVLLFHLYTEFPLVYFADILYLCMCTTVIFTMTVYTYKHPCYIDRAVLIRRISILRPYTQYGYGAVRETGRPYKLAWPPVLRRVPDSHTKFPSQQLSLYYNYY
jgi:hypothetical protein